MKIVDNRLLSVIPNDLEYDFKLIIPDNVVEIDDDIFEITGLDVEELILPNSIIYIDTNVFSNRVPNLKKITIPKNISKDNFIEIIKSLGWGYILDYFKNGDGKLFKIMDTIKLCAEIKEYYEENNITVPKEVIEVCSLYEKNNYILDNSFKFLGSNEKIECTINVNKEIVTLIFDRRSSLSKGKIQIKTNNYSILNSLGISSDLCYKLCSNANLEEIEKNYLKLKEKNENLGFTNMIEHHLNNIENTIKIKDIVDLYQKIDLLNEIIDSDKLEQYNLDKVNLKEFIFETKYLDVNYKVKIIIHSKKIEFINLDNDFKLEMNLKDIINKNSFFVDIDFIKSLISKLENEVIDEFYNAKTYIKFSYNKKFDKKCNENVQDEFNLSKEYAFFEFLKNVKDLKELEELEEYFGLVISYKEEILKLNFDYGVIGSETKDYRIINPKCHFFDYLYLEDGFYIVNKKTNEKVKIAFNNYSKHIIAIDDKLKDLIHLNTYYIQKFKSDYEVALRKRDIFESNPAIKMINALKEKKIDAELIREYKIKMDDDFFNQYLDLLIKKDMLKYLDLSNKVFTNIENMNLSNTNAKINLQELEKKSIKGANLTNVALLGQNLDNIDCSGAVLIGTHVRVDLSKTVITDCVFDETCMFWLGSKEISADEARMLGANIIKKDVKKIKLKF